MTRGFHISSYSFIYKMIGGAVGIFTVSNYINGSEKFYDDVLIPLVNTFGPDKARHVALFANKYKLIPKSRYQDPPLLNCNFETFATSNPIGICAEFDQEGESLEGLFNVGFGFVQLNALRLMTFDDPMIKVNFTTGRFLQTESQTLPEINLPDSLVHRIEKIREHPNFCGVVGVSLGSLNSGKDAIRDYVNEVYKFGPISDYLLVTIDTEKKIKLETLISELKSAIKSLPKQPNLFIKLPLNTTCIERQKIAAVINRYKYKITGVIIPATLNPESDVDPISDMYKLTSGNIVIIGDGGISTGYEAYRKIKAGASLIQIYSPLIEHGPPRIKRIKKDLEKCLKFDGFENISEAVGIDVRRKEKHYYFPFY